MALNSCYNIFETLSTVVSPSEHARIKEELENSSIPSLPDVEPALSQTKKMLTESMGTKGVIPLIPKSSIAVRIGDGLDGKQTWRE